MNLRPGNAIDLTKTTNPVVYEINTWPWLQTISTREGAAVDLGSVPDRYWDELAGLGCDAVWLMGVWRRSPAGVAVALSNMNLLAGFRAAGLAVSRRRRVAVLCARLRRRRSPGRSARPCHRPRGAALPRRRADPRLRPEPCGTDHHWTTTNPELFVLATDEQLEQDPTAFVRVGGRVFANGRDPYFPAWPDVVQLNAFAPELRAAAGQTLQNIAEHATACAATWRCSS